MLACPEAKKKKNVYVVKQKATCFDSEQLVQSNNIAFSA